MLLRYSISNKRRSSRSNYIMRHLTVVFISCAIFTIHGCEWSRGVDDNGGIDLVELLEEAWETFTSKDYVLSEYLFVKVIEYDSNIGEAYLGCGWSRLMQEQITEAQTDFTTARDFPSVSTDARAGLALAEYLSGNYIEVISNATTVLDSDSLYAFSHLLEYNYMDLLLIRAASNFALGENNYEDVITDVSSISTIMELGIEIESNDPSTWLVNGQQYESLNAAITAALNLLFELIA